MHDEKSAPGKQPRRRKRPFWARLLRTVLISYLLIVLMLLLLEGYLVFPAPRADQGDWHPEFSREEVSFASADETELVGWILHHEQPQHYIVFFHGNAEHVAYCAPQLDFIREQFQATVFGVDYRGYGKSGGRPNQAGLLRDGIAAVEYFASSQQVDTEQLIVMGRSLGGAVAVHTASQIKVKGLVLESTFDSMVAIAARQFPWLPVRWLMRNQFPSEKWAVAVDVPVLQFHGTDDDLITMEQAKRLHRALASQQKEFVAVDGVGHNDPMPTHFYQKLADFLDQ